MKTPRLWILLGAIAVLIAALLFLNFRLAWSSTQADKSIITTSIGEGLPYPMQRREKITIALVGESPLAGALRQSLAAELGKAGLGDIELAQELAPAYPNPVLVVKIAKPGLLWTPFFASARFPIQAGYASTGDTSFMGKTPATIDNKNGPALNLYVEYTISDRTWGLISRPGYHQILADYLAQNIVAALKDLYKV